MFDNYDSDYNSTDGTDDSDTEVNSHSKNPTKVTSADILEGEQTKFSQIISSDDYLEHSSDDFESPNHSRIWKVVSTHLDSSVEEGVTYKGTKKYNNTTVFDNIEVHNVKEVPRRWIIGIYRANVKYIRKLQRVQKLGTCGV